MSDTATPTISTPGAVRLPVASIPAVVLPGAVVTLTLASEELRSAVAAARRTSEARVVLHAGSGEIAVVAQVPDVGSLPSGDPAAVVRIEGRARIGALHQSERGATYADAELITDPRPTPRVEALGRELRGVLGVVAELRRSRRLPELLRTVTNPGALADGVATWAEFDDNSKAAVLGAVDVGERVQLVLDWARNHVAELQVAESIRNDVTEGVDKQQREYLLRQQLEAIRKELGEGDGDVVAEYRTKLAEVALRRPLTTRSARRSTGSNGRARSPPSTGGSEPGSTASSSCRGTREATTTSTSPTCAPCSMPTTTGSTM